MNRKKKLDNRGFSLVELIIVIAIMVILVGLLAPQYIKYLDKSRIAADTQLADNVRQAMTTTLLDPTVTKNVPKASTATTALGAKPSVADAEDYWQNVYEVLGVADSNALIAALKYDSTNVQSGSDNVTITYSTDANSNITVIISGGKYTTNNKTITVK